MTTLRSLSAALILEKNKANSIYPFLLLIDVTVNGVNELYYVRNTEDVTFNGQLYTAFPFEIDDDKSTSSGDIPSLQIRVCNVNRAIQAYLEAYDGLVGETVTLYIVNSNLLAESYADYTFDFTILGTVADAYWATFTLGAPNLLIKRFPLHRYVGNFCRFVGNFKGAECRYSGSYSKCNGTLSDCEARGNTSRFGGFPGLVSGSVRLA